CVCSGDAGGGAPAAGARIGGRVFSAPVLLLVLLFFPQRGRGRESLKIVAHRIGGWVSNVLQYSALSIIRCLYFAVLLVPGFASTAKAQEPDCAEFETLREGLRAILRDYRQHDDPRFLHDLVAASRTARACARTDGERIVTYDYESWTLGALDRLEDAVKVLEAATRLAPPAEEYYSAWVNVYGCLAYMLFRLGRFAETQHVYAQALRHTEALPLGRRLLRLYTQHANALAQMSAFGEAMERLVEIEALIEAGEAELSREEYEGWLGR